MTQIEIAVQDAAGAEAARDAGADRVEVCSALSLGGLTPSAGLLDRAIAAADGRIDVHVLIRPRPGTFVTSEDELAVMVDDVRHARDSGVSGVVIGTLRRDSDGASRLDRRQLDALVAAAHDIEVTFHRALDQIGDVRHAIGELVDSGVTRVLTSGGASRVHDGLPRLAHTVEAAAGRLQVMAGGGLDLERLDEVLTLGVDAVHLSAKRIRSEPATTSLGGATEPGVLRWEETDPGAVRRAVWLARQYSLSSTQRSVTF